LHVSTVLPIRAKLCGVTAPDFRQTIGIFPGTGVVVEWEASIKIDLRSARYSRGITVTALSDTESATCVNPSTIKAGIWHQIEWIGHGIELSELDSRAATSLQLREIRRIYKP